ncbi:MAG: hypothetical protein MRY74_05045 [Neomegalonema sp.]|nr:hypothetical protein [Neomegalonema sp.]
MASSAKKAYHRLEEELADRLAGASGGEPVDVSQIISRTLRIKLDVSLWTSTDIRCETVPGDNPEGEVVGDAAAARAALLPIGAALEAEGAFADQLKSKLEAAPDDLFTGSQGGWRGDALPDRRSVVRKCAACAGAGGFACEACEGGGDKLCDRCFGTGEVDQLCGACANRPTQNAKPSWDEAALSFRKRTTAADADPDCPVCKGAGAHKAPCEKCHGAKRVDCGLCNGTGRVECAECGGAGAQTDIYSVAPRFDYSNYLSCDEQVSRIVESKLRRGVQILARSGRLQAKFIGLKSDKLGYRASFTVEKAVTGARIGAGRRSPRVMAELYAIDEPPVLIDPPPLIDKLHQRALDNLRHTGRDNPRAIADALSARALGRAALTAAARRDLRFDASAFEPLATPGYAARLFELAKTCHRFAGWRIRRWFWPAAAIGAPLFVAMLDAIGATSIIAGWTSVAAASSGVDAAIAQRDAAANGVIFGRIGAIALWWLLAASAAALVYRRSVRRILGVARAATTLDVLRAGPAPLLGLIAGAGLTALFVSLPPPDPKLLARAGEIAKSVAARRAAALARIRAEAEAPSLSSKWDLVRSKDGALIARVAAESAPEVVFSVRCRKDDAWLRLQLKEKFKRRARLSVGLSTNRRSLGVLRARVVGGALEWRADRRILTALRYGTWARLEVLGDGAERPKIDVTLDGSAEAIGEATRRCQSSS